MDPVKLAAAIERIDIQNNARYEYKNENDGIDEGKYIKPTKWFVVDTSTAEPEVNWPGDLISEHDTLVEAKLGYAKALILLAKETK